MVLLIFIGGLGKNPQRIGKGTRKLGNKRTSGDHSDFSIAMIGQNVNKCPADLRGLVTQTAMETHLITLV